MLATGNDNSTQPPTAIDRVAELDAQCRQLMNRQRDPAAVELASQVTSGYRQLNQREQISFLMKLNSDYDVDPAAIIRAAKEYENQPGAKNHQTLSRVVEAPRQKLFRCINAADDGLQTLIRMRQDLLEFDVPVRIGLAGVENDLKHLLQSWFNRGFLELQRIDWQSPASLLEKLIQYEAVHQIRHWDDLRRRLQADRRCFAFFHPSMKDEPLVFVEVALTDQIADNIDALISPVSAVADPQQASTAMFYSISSCQPGLAGISFGGLLIKHVVNEVRRDLPNVTTFSTLSPVPGFCRWLGQQAESQPAELQQILKQLASDSTTITAAISAEFVEALAPHRQQLLSQLASYLLTATIDDRPIDSVARFHLGNGAQLQAIHWLADISDNGLRKSLGMMVNYVYEIAQIQTNRQNFLQHKIISAHPTIHALTQAAKGDQMQTST